MMPQLRKYVFTLACLLVGLFPQVGSSAPQILYLYGDVAADGTVPSGDQAPFHQMRLDDTGPRGLSQFSEAIRQLGFRLTEAYDAETELNDALLAPLQVLILGSNQRRFTGDEAAAVRRYVENGGGLVAWSDSAFGGHWRQVGVDNPAGRLSNNDLTTSFGMYFMTDNGAGNYLIQEQAFDHFLNAYRRKGGVEFRGEGVSPVRVSPPARLLAKLQEGGLGGKLRLNAVDGSLDPERDAALAIAEVGEGRVVGIFDRNLFWNAGEGTRLSHADNRAFTQRVMLWAAGRENDPQMTARIGPIGTAPSASSATLAAVRLSAESDARGVARLRAHLPRPHAQAEVSWRLLEGPGKVSFDNNNPNGPAIGVRLSASGRYRFLAEIKDGGQTITREVAVTR